jgi:hypothetical protein
MYTNREQTVFSGGEGRFLFAYEKLEFIFLCQKHHSKEGLSERIKLDL